VIELSTYRLELLRNDKELNLYRGSSEYDDSQILVQAFIAEAELPKSIIDYVVRASESVILDDALVQNPFSNDDYFLKHQPRSVLCLLLIKQTKVIGVLYLENNLAPYVFTPTGSRF